MEKFTHISNSTHPSKNNRGLKICEATCDNKIQRYRNNLSRQKICYVQFRRTIDQKINNFDVTIGSYSEAEACELIVNKYNPKNIVL